MCTVSILADNSMVIDRAGLKIATSPNFDVLINIFSRYYWHVSLRPVIVTLSIINDIQQRRWLEEVLSRVLVSAAVNSGIFQ